MRGRVVSARRVPSRSSVRGCPPFQPFGSSFHCDLFASNARSLTLEDLSMRLAIDCSGALIDSRDLAFVELRQCKGPSCPEVDLESDAQDCCRTFSPHRKAGQAELCSEMRWSNQSLTHRSLHNGSRYGGLHPFVACPRV